MTLRPGRLLRRFIARFTSSARDRDMDQEMAFHLESIGREYVQAGMSEAEADRAARARFGSVLRLKEEGHEIRGARLLEEVARDIRHTGRWLRRSPGFAAAVVLTLALGIGATTAVFSIVDAVILRPLAYEDPDRLYAVHEVIPAIATTVPLVPVNARHYQEWRAAARSFEDMALIGPLDVEISGNGDPERMAAARVSPSLFGMLGIQAQIGRTLAAAEDEPGRDRVVLLRRRSCAGSRAVPPCQVPRDRQIRARSMGRRDRYRGQSTAESSRPRSPHASRAARDRCRAR